MSPVPQTSEQAVQDAGSARFERDILSLSGEGPLDIFELVAVTG